MEKLLEDAGVKLSVVVTDIFGMSGRDMIDALINEERDPHILADLACGRMRRKLHALAEALVGHLDDHHAFLARMICRHVDHLDQMIADLDTRIDAQMAPMRAPQGLLDTIDGINKRTAEVIIAEIGTDMNRFPTAAHLASWAGLCPGNNKTGGKAKPGHVRPGDRWLKAILGSAALGATRKKDTYLNAQYRRIAACRGAKRAQTAVGRDRLAHSSQRPLWTLGGCVRHSG